jgi:sulfite exporter TauE/SafE
MLVALGLYLTGLTQTLAFIERIGQKLWMHIQPLTAHFLPANNVSRALPLGMLWGFLPCGMVYSVLAMALVSGSPQRGAGLMLAFGMGTLPNLLLAGVLLKFLRDISRARAVRMASGLLVMGFGIFGLIKASKMGEHLLHGMMRHV